MAVEGKLYTVSEYEAFIGQPENAERLFELIDGEIVEKVVTQKHGIIAAKICARIVVFLEQNPIGRVGVEVRHRAGNDEHNDRLPDVSFISDVTKPVVEEGPVQSMPDLAAEIKSPDQSYKLMSEKAAYYLANGSRMVWLVYPEKQIVEVLTAKDRQILVDTDVLEGGEVLPGFKMTVRDLFAM